MRNLALALPFVLGAFGARAAVVPLGDTLARVLVSIAPEPPKPAPPDPDPEAEPEPEALPIEAKEHVAPAKRVAKAEAAPARETGTEELADGPKGTIVIPASAVTRALEKKDIRATNAKSPEGVRLHGVGRYGVGLRDGDVVIKVQGTRTKSVEAMVQAAMGAASAGATRLTGTIRRGEATYDVVLEIPRP